VHVLPHAHAIRVVTRWNGSEEGVRAARYYVSLVMLSHFKSESRQMRKNVNKINNQKNEYPYALPASVRSTGSVT